MAENPDALKTLVGGVWKDTGGGNTHQVLIGGVWRQVERVKTIVGGAWKDAYVRSDPRTYYFEATDSESWRPSGWRISGDIVYTGSWDNGDHIGVMVFGDDTVYAETMSEAMAVRPTIVGTPKLRLTRENTAHGYATGSGTIYLGSYTGTIRTGSADNDVDITPTSTYTSGVARGETIEIDMDNQLITDMQNGRELWVANQTSSWSGTGGQDTSYYKFEGHSVGTPPRVEVTLDY